MLDLDFDRYRPPVVNLFDAQPPPDVKSHKLVPVNSPLKVAQCLAGAPYGGAENFYTRLVRSLAGEDSIQQQAFTRPNEFRVPQIAAAEVPVQTFRYGNWFHFFDNWRYRQALKQFNPDIVLTFMNRPSSLTPRGDYTLVCRLGHYYNLKYYRHADYWIGVSKGICQHLIDGGMPAEKVFYIPNFADEVEVAPIPRDSFNTPPDRPVLLAAGRLHTNKAFDTLLRTLADIPEATLWLAGDGPEKPALQRLAARLNIRHRIRFLGWRNDIPQLMRSADLFVCPSRHEGLGGIVLESWYHCCPIVATRSQGPEELIDHNKTGLLSPVDDVDALGENINRLIKNPGEGRLLASRARGVYEEQFSESIVGQKYVEFFHSILAR